MNIKIKMNIDTSRGMETDMGKDMDMDMDADMDMDTDMLLFCLVLLQSKNKLWTIRSITNSCQICIQGGG
jgi:hypothetical protein